ncbi:MAG TPA: class I SAM-dependent RNA methyltransferase [Pyrinomonadaceae bacterium]|nr:class I SAM-dependent RNA methyltransferase [Pyrinomonadaceae bacterium]
MRNEEIYELKIERIVPKGLGIGFAEKMTFFVPLTAAGDVVKVKINQKKGKIAFAEVVEVLKPSPERVEPPCQYFGKCGGCDFQQMNYQAQLSVKVGIIKDCLKRIGKIELEKEIEIIGSPREFNYRARAAWHLDTRRRKIGYFKRNSHEIIDVENCPILTEDLQKTLEDLRKTVEWETFWSNRVEIEAANSDGKVSIYSDELVEPTEELVFSAYGEQYLYSANSFFQGNPFLINTLIEKAVGDISGKHALDLYCGVGLFTLPLARKFERVTGVEGNRKAIEFAQKNIENARIENAEVFAESVGEWLIENASTLENIDFVLLDPPRTGAEKETIEEILRLKPRQISYVSCEPSVLARDLRILIDGGYEIESIVAVDLFPQTHHVETLVKLTLV